MTVATDRAGPGGFLGFRGKGVRGKPPVDKFWEEPDIPPVFKIGGWFALAILLLPVVIVVLAGLNAGDFLTFPPDGLSLRWVNEFLTNEQFLGAYLFSLQLALTTTVISTVIGTMAAVFLARTSLPGLSVLRAYFLASTRSERRRSQPCEAPAQGRGMAEQAAAAPPPRQTVHKVVQGVKFLIINKVPKF